MEIRKEAEASFSQVFTATNTSGKTSILKVIELKLSTDGKSLKRDTAISLETIMPEILITECLSQLVGFVENKAVHVLVGRPSPSIAVAYSIFAEQNETQFPLPSSYSPRSAFLLLEQDHAGMVLEEFPLLTCQDMTDVLLETITHLGIAERFLQFEVLCSPNSEPAANTI